MTRLIGYIAALLLISNIATAQRNLKYENIVKKAETVGNKEAFGLYSDFLSMNPLSDRANLYYKLAELSSAIMQEMNPLNDYPKIKDLYLKSTDYYSLCLRNLTDDNARKDQTLFTMVRPTQRRMTADDISTYINLKRESDSIFFTQATSFFKAYSSMIAYYYSCMETYKKICSRNRSLNDIYINMETNRSLLDRMIADYDSIFVFKDKLSSKLPNLSFIYKKPEVFKIDGFTPSDFKIAPEIWDYKSWALDRIVYYEQTVLPLLQISSDMVKELDDYIDSLNMSKKTAPKPEFNHDKFLAKLMDLQNITSLYSEIMQKNKVINFLNIFYDEKNKPISDSYSVNEQSAYIYSLTEAYNRIVAGATEIKLNYPALTKDITEVKPVAELYYRALENYKQYIINAENLSGEKEYLSYNKTNIPKFRGSGFYRPSNSGYITKHVLKNDNGLFLGGASISIQGFSIAYTAFAEDSRNINWVKNTDISKLIYDDCTMALCNIPGGIMSLVSSKNISDPKFTTQTIVKYDVKGNEKQKITLPDKDLPLGRLIYYDDITETTLLAFYGENEDWFQDSSQLIVKQLSKDFQEIFKSEIKLNGKLLNIFPSNNGNIIVFGNFSEYENTTIPGIFSLIIDQTGTVVKTTIYDSKNPQYGIYAGKYAPNRFIIAGTSGETVKNDATPYPITGAPIIILTNDLGETIYNSDKAKLEIESFFD